jgi:hypothetical protein
MKSLGKNYAVGLGVGALAGAAASRFRPLSSLSTAQGAGVGAIAGSFPASIASLAGQQRRDKRDLEAKGFEYSYLTGVKKVPDHLNRKKTSETN